MANPQKLKRPLELKSKIIHFFEELELFSEGERQALVITAGLDQPLRYQINFAGPVSAFCSHMVETLMLYGQLQDGRDALEAVLEHAKERIGDANLA